MSNQQSAQGRGPVRLANWLTAAFLVATLIWILAQVTPSNGQENDHFIYLPVVVSNVVETTEPISSTPTPAPTPTPTLIPELIFLETFDDEVSNGETPSSPQPWTDENWDISIHQRDQDRLYEMFEIPAHHGANCEPPPASHTITSYEDSLYTCKNHMMTSIYGASNDGGYGLIYFTPNRLVDTTGDFMIQFDMSTHRTNHVRNWVDIWITPYDQNLQLAIHEFEPDLQGAPLEAIQIRLLQENLFSVTLHENGRETDLELNNYTQYHEVLQMSKKTRSLFSIGVENGRLKVGMPQHDLWWHDQPAPEMLTRPDWSESVVQFGHHSYTPAKMCEFSFFPDECFANGGDTFHWDNVFVYPAKPFNLVHGSPRLITESTEQQTFTADSPAPTNAYLRFAGIGNNLEVSFNQGVTWHPAVEQAHSKTAQNLHFRSYWMPVPAGTTTVHFRGQPWGEGNNQWAARDITFWAKESNPERQTAESRSPTPAEEEFFASIINGSRSPDSFFCDPNAANRTDSWDTQNLGN